MEKFLEGLEKLDNGLYRIRETMEINHSKVAKVPIQEEKILVEGKETTPSKVGYRFKVWNSDPSEKGFNYNGRNYSKVVPIALEQNLSTVSLMNHPEDEGDVRNICGVTKDSRLDDDGWMSCLFIPCGEYGKLVSDVIEAGGPISVSSSILGELDDNGFVKPENYVMERELDIVFGPSNGLNHYKNKVEYQGDNGSRDTISEEDITEMEESVDKSKLTISDSENLEKGDNKMADKLVETSMKMNINSMVKDADKKENLYEKRDALNEALGYANELTDKSLAEEIQNKVSSVDEELKVLSEKGLKTDELSDSVKELTETKEKLEKEIKVMQYEKSKLSSKVDTITKMYEDKQYKASEEELLRNRKLAKEVCTLKMESKEKDSQIQKLLRENKLLKRKMEESEAISNTKVDTEDYADLQETVKELTDKNAFLLESLQKAKSKIRMVEASNSRNSRFDSVRTRVMANRKPLSNRVKESTSSKMAVKSTITEEDDEDKLMEKMLNK